MNVLMQGRYGLMNAMGGDRIQIENTAEELKKLGVNVDIATSIIDDVSKYDLVHVFQLDWTPETHFMVKNAKKAGKPLVFSPIHHNVAEVKKFDDEYVFDYRRLSKILFSEQHQRDTFKNVYRSIFNPLKIKPTLYSIFIGLKNMHKETLQLSDVVLVQTILEAKDLRETYGVDFVWVKVPNGVGENFLNPISKPCPFNFKDYIFSVGRVEPRKNQLKLIESVSVLRKELNKDIKLVLVGKKNPKIHFEYTQKFNKMLIENPWVYYLESVSYSDMPSYFKYAKVSVSVSWFETTGLTLLEALYCNSNAVASSPRAEEILGNYASYCDPSDIASMTRAIKKEYLRPRPEIDDAMKKEYTWQNAAKKTLEVYRSLINKA